MTATLTVGPPAMSVAEERHLVDRCLRAEAMAPSLATLAGAAPGDSCQILDAKYEPRSTLTVLYRLGRRQVSVAVPLAAGGPATGWGAELGSGARAFVFPADPVLHRLAEVLDPRVMGGVVGDALGRRVVTCRVEVLRYRPGKRCTLAVTARVAGRHGFRALTLVGKVYASAGKAAAVFEESRRLAALVGPGSPLILAEPVAFAPEVPLVFQTPIRGAALDSLVAAPVPGGVERRARHGTPAAARALAAIHAMPLVSERVRSAETELHRFASRAGRIAEVDPRTGAVLAGAVEVLAERFAQLSPAEVALVHGDCKPSQFLLDGGAAAVLDFDHCGRADPASDVGAWMGAVRKVAVMEFLDRRAGGQRRAASLLSLEDAFLEAYGLGRPGDDLEARARWHQGAALVRKALRAFARAPRSPLPAALADQARTCARGRQ